MPYPLVESRLSQYVSFILTGRDEETRVRSEVTWPTIPAMLRAAAGQWPGTEAVVDGERRVHVTGPEPQTRVVPLLA